MGLDSTAARLAVLGFSAAATFGAALPAVGAAIAVGGNMAIGVIDARRLRRQVEQNKTQRDLTIAMPPPDGVMITELPFTVPGESGGPEARMQWLRDYFATPPASPWDRMLLDERDGYPVIRGIDARNLAVAPALAEPRPEDSGGAWTKRCIGHCMAPWLDDGDEVAIDPGAEPVAGEIVAAYVSHPDVPAMAKWLLAPVPPRALWGQYPDAVAILGSADHPEKMVAIPLLSIEMLVRIAPAREPAAAKEGPHEPAAVGAGAEIAEGPMEYADA